MRIVKLSSQLPTGFKSIDDVREFFLSHIEQRDPPGRFEVTHGRIAQNELKDGEPLIFVYQARVVFTARAASGLLPNDGDERRRYPNYFVVDVTTLREVNVELREIERFYNEVTGESHKLGGQGWNHLPSSVHVDALWTRLSPMNIEEHELSDEEIDRVLRENRLRIGIVATDSKQACNRQRRGQDQIRKLTLGYYRSCCAVCDVSDESLLVASHVVGWAEDPEHQGKLSNVMCLCRFHDALFESGYWSLNDGFDVMRKDSIESETIRELLNTMKFRMPSEIPPSASFLRLHRKKHGFGT